jgi:hypothetical protein
MNPLLNEKEVARLIGLSVHWLRRMRFVGGGIVYIKFNGAVRHRLEDVEEYIAGHVLKSTSTAVIATDKARSQE